MEGATLGRWSWGLKKKHTEQATRSRALFRHLPWPLLQFFNPSSCLEFSPFSDDSLCCEYITDEINSSLPKLFFCFFCFCLLRQGLSLSQSSNKLLLLVNVAMTPSKVQKCAANRVHSGAGFRSSCLNGVLLTKPSSPLLNFYCFSSCCYFP